MVNEDKEFNQIDFDEIRSHFGDKTIKERYSYIYEKIQEYIFERHEESVLSINEDILHQVVMDYFADIYRLKKFHRIERINITKIVAYEVYWLWRRKPIQILNTSNNSPKEVFANEGFLTVFIAHECLGVDATVPMSDDQEKAYLKFLSHINYCLKYRAIERQAIETMLMAVEMGKVLK